MTPIRVYSGRVSLSPIAVLMFTTACRSRLNDGRFLVTNTVVSWSCKAGSLDNPAKSIYDPTGGEFEVERSGLGGLHLFLENYQGGSFVSFDCKRGSSDTFSCDPFEQATSYCIDTGDAHGDLVNTYTLSGEITSRTTFIGTLTDHSEWVGDDADDPGCNQCLVSYTFDATWYTDL